MRYAGFWVRTLAALIDLVILSLATGLLVEAMAAIFLPGVDIESLMRASQEQLQAGDMGAYSPLLQMQQQPTAEGAQSDESIAALTALSERINAITAQMTEAGHSPEQLQEVLQEHYAQQPAAEQQYGDLIHLLLVLIGMLAATIVFVALYETLTTALPMRGTPGKWLLGLAVTDENGQALSFGQSLARHGAKGLSVLLLMIGCFMVAFDSRKQGLHDKMCKTLVVFRKNTTGGIT